ncbi:MAG: RluA family pseudouridine synthase [Bacteroidales bacterium]
MHITVLFESPDLIAVSKPVMVSTIPGGKAEEICLLHHLEETRKEKLWVVHRLDKEVSGLVLFARNEQMHKYLNDLFLNREISKTYLALVTGNIREKDGTVDAPIKEFGSGRMGVTQAGGKESITQYELVAKGHGHSLLKVKPLTGRRHQIRVHLYHIGHPVAGDQKYGDKKTQMTYPRLMLHAFTLEFLLQNGEMMSLKCSPPPEFRETLTMFGISGVKWER